MQDLNVRRSSSLTMLSPLMLNLMLINLENTLFVYMMDTGKLAELLKEIIMTIC